MIKIVKNPQISFMKDTSKLKKFINFSSIIILFSDKKETLKIIDNVDPKKVNKDIPNKIKIT
jgi:hypothetical protein